MSFTTDDLRRALPAPAARSGETGDRAPREPTVLAWAAPGLPDPQEGHSHWARGQNFCLAHTTLAPGQAVTEIGVPDEHLVLLPHEGASITVTTDLGPAVLDQPGLVIVPPGASSLVSDRQCTVLRVFTSRARGIADRTQNAAAYAHPDPAVAPLPQTPRPPGRPPRVVRLAEIPRDPARLGRILRTDSLMINWFPPQDGPRDPDKLSPHVHEDFEQASVTLQGDFVHHFRSPWTPRLSEWRPDQAVRCASPSVAVIPPGIVHTTRAVDEGRHDLIDVFAPPRADFAALGWVLNADEYPDRTAP
ncbi:MAG TPA: hypothetical protein VGX23_19500 [Actinocrinis sp.]|nr:hypothetical protein [Actinocrinis sp.]